MSKTIDSFGFQNQGKNYGKFRPSYPQSLYTQSLNSLNSKNKYLDIAMGTGQLLFNIAPFFNQSKGLDISDKMLDAAKSQLASEFPHLKDKIFIQKCDVLSIESDEKFDLITVGQALHWLPVKESLEKIKNILQPEGKLLIISYIVKGLQDQNQDIHYQNFYELTKQTKPDFVFDRDQLHKHYEDKNEYPFEQYFKNVKMDAKDVKIQMPKSTYINYMKTYAGYNQMMSKGMFKEDPIKKLEENTRGETVTVVIDYFNVECSNSQSTLNYN